MQHFFKYEMIKNRIRYGAEYTNALLAEFTMWKAICYNITDKPCGNGWNEDERSIKESVLSHNSLLLEKNTYLICQTDPLFLIPLLIQYEYSKKRVG